MTAQPTPIDLAAFALLEAKAAEEVAHQARLDAEAALLALVKTKEEGSTTTKAAYYKVVTTGKLIRSLVMEEVETLPQRIGHDYFEDLIRYRPELSLSGLRKIEKESQVAYAEVLKCIITKPAKTSVSVELIEQ